MTIEIRQESDALHAEVWRFYFEDRRCTLWLDDYRIEERATTRHKFKIVKHYNRLDCRNNTLQLNDVPLTPELIDKAKTLFMNQLSIKKWDKD